MFNLYKEHLVSTETITRMLPVGSGGKPPHISTVWRWITEGSYAPSGEKAFLEAVRIDGKWYSSREALARFVEKLTYTKGIEKLPSHARSGRKRGSIRLREAAKEMAVPA